MLFDADEITDSYTRVRLYWSLGAFDEQVEPRAALDSFRRAVVLLEATEDTLHLARAHMACAEAAMMSIEVTGEPSGTSSRPSACSGRRTGQRSPVVRRMQAMCAAQAGD